MSTNHSVIQSFSDLVIQLFGDSVIRKSRRGFTLMEVNLAIMVMATGILGMCCLYVFGYRENRQSVEDVVTVSFADTYLAPLVQGLSATNMTWSEWCQIGTAVGGDRRRLADAVAPANGWRDYIDLEDAGSSYRVRPNPSGTADSTFSAVMSHVPSPYRGSRPSLDSDYNYALVVTRCGARIQLAFRVSKRRDFLMAQPCIVSEVHFQGVPDK